MPAPFLGLVHFPAYAPEIFSSAAFFLLVQVASPFISPLISSSYRTHNAKTRRDWDVRVVSTVNILTVLPLAIECFRHNDVLGQDKAFGSHPAALRLCAVAAGYFLWDTGEALSRRDWPFVLHGASTLFIFVFGLRPFVLYYAPISLMWELSTPFLNIHWFLDKTNRTGGTLQLVNGIALLGTFFSARIVYGGWASYDLFKTLWRVRNDIPIWVSAVYYLGNVTLNTLNWIWFFKMIDALRRRFTKGDDRKLKKVATEDAISASKDL